MDAGALFAEIAKVCPVTLTRVGVPDERDTWSYEAPGATPEQKAAADNVVATIPMKVANTVTVWEFINRWTNAEYKALITLRNTDNGHTGKLWDIVMSANPIKMEKGKVQNLKVGLVTDGVLTQARADEIFS